MEKINSSYSFGSLKVNRIGYGSMQLTGKGVFGPVADYQCKEGYSGSDLGWRKFY